LAISKNKSQNDEFLPQKIIGMTTSSKEKEKENNNHRGGKKN
jgi:hypothetical protein